MVESVAIIMLMGTLIIGIISAYWHNRQKKYLLTHIAVDNNIGIQAKKLLENMGLEGQVAVGITIFDVFYNSIKIDPFALRGIDHLHHSQNFENLGQLVSFMKESIIKDPISICAFHALFAKFFHP